MDSVIKGIIQVALLIQQTQTNDSYFMNYHAMMKSRPIRTKMILGKFVTATPTFHKFTHFFKYTKSQESSTAYYFGRSIFLT